MKNEKKYLKEQSIVDAAADAINAEEVVDLTQPDEEGFTELEEELDNALVVNMGKVRRAEKRGKNPDEFVNILVTGPAGIGKTAIVKQWARRNNVRLFEVDAKSLDIGDIGGAIAPDRETGKFAIKLGTTQFDALELVDGKYAVLFLDEFNRADAQVRGSLLTLINNHMIPDPTVAGGMRYLKGFLFTVAAVNPSTDDSGYGTTRFDPAELSRFLQIDMKPSPFAVLKHLTKEYGEDIAAEEDNEVEVARLQGRLDLAKTLLSHRDFEFDTPETELKAYENQVGILNPRSLKIALDASDGTKDSFLRKYPKACGPEQLANIKRILSGYKDKDNKANSVFKKDFKLPNSQNTAQGSNQTTPSPAAGGDTSDSIFAKKTTSKSADMLKDYLKNTGL